MRVRWLGEACLEVIGEENLLIDPNYKVKPAVIPDRILVTHEHDDHLDPEVINDFNQAELFAPASVYNNFDLQGQAVKGGDIIDGKIKVLDCDCYGSEQAVSYYCDGLFHTADTADFPEIDDEVKLLFSACFSDFYQNYVKAASRLNPDLVVPYHYDYYNHQNMDEAKGLISRLKEAGISSRLLSPGEELIIN